MSYDILFTPAKIGTMRVKNRLVMPPMVRNYANEDGSVNDRYLAHIERIAAGGVGMMILEAIYISPEGKGFTHQLGIHNNMMIPGLRMLAAAAHKHGAKIGCQIYHAGRQTVSAKTGVQPVAPSPVPCPLLGEMPHELTIPEIEALVQKYSDAALRAKEAGLDFVEIHGAHGYLITQFLSPFSNKRKDKYGGTPEKRMRFAIEVVESIRQAVGDKFPLVMRLSGEEMVPGGLTLQDTKRIAKALEAAGVDAFHISVGNYGSYSKGYMLLPMAREDGALVKYATGVKSAVKVPVIAVGKLRDPKMDVALIKNGKADFLAIGRTLLADPDWPNKVKKGQVAEINPCIACNQGCITRLFAEQDVQCTVNPACGREIEFAKRGKKKKVVVVGGGPAGMSAAKTAAMRGAKVILFEKSKKLGGQLFLAAAAPHREGWEELRKALVRDMKRLKVDVRLGKEFTAADAKRLKPNQVIYAVGSKANEPPIVGVEAKHVFTSREVLSGKKKLKGPIVLVGGGCAGAQTAEYVAKKGFNTTLVELYENIAADAPMDERALLLERLAKLGVAIQMKTRVMRIKDDCVQVRSGVKQSCLPAKTVILCLGSKSSNEQIRDLRKVVRNLTVVGDAKRPRRVTDAMEEGALAVL